MTYPFRQNAIAALFTAGAATLAMADEAVTDTVVVSASRTAHASSELAAAIDVVDATRVGAAQARVNLSEALAAVPGLVAQNRQNYAQDLQVSSRGFGARSTFGVRGVRLVADGIPASMPDGQGQAATFNLDVAERIEVLRGPFSAIYGNHAGGVIQLFTADGEGAPSVELNLMAGSDGQRKTDLSAQGKPGAIGYVLDASRFQTDGVRAHSAATRDQSFAKLTLAPTAGGRLTLVASALRQDDTQDPLGVTWATYARDPRAGEIDTTDTQAPKRTFAERYNTRKSIDHQQAGLAFDQQLGDGRLHLALYGGNRQVIQFQAFSKAFQAPASHSGGVVDFDRNFYGADLNWVHTCQAAGGKLTATVGLEYGHSSDERKGYENFIGAEFGVVGKLRREENDVVASLDPYAQLEWQSGAWMLTAGLRHSRLNVRVDDRFLTNGNDSGTLNYQHTTPVLGTMYKVSPGLHLYASAARAFETPTLNELFYSGTGGGFNFTLRPSTSTHWEAGAKARFDTLRLNAAVFEARTSDELVIDSASGGRTSYRNASSTLRQGAELSLDATLGHGVSTRLALTSLRAVYAQGFGSVAAGSRLPGVPNANAYAELAWKSPDGQLEAAIDASANGRIYAEDANAERPAPGYAVANLRLQAKQALGGWQFKEFARLNNVQGRQYVGSLIVGDTNKRFYEGAPGRNWMLGASAHYTF
ncbi:MAG: TonB-dependent receptor [Pseudomonadota bacterium]